MGKSRHVKHYQKYDIDAEYDEYHRNDKFKNRRQTRLKRVHDKHEEIEEDGEFQFSE